MSEEEEVVIPPKKKGNKLTRWFKTRTGQTVTAIVSAAVITQAPALAPAIEQTLDGISKGDALSIGGGIAAILAGIARARSA